MTNYRLFSDDMKNKNRATYLSLTLLQYGVET